MNPIYDCPINISLEEMKLYIEDCGSPALLIDGQGRLLARNEQADGKNVPTRLGASVKGLVAMCELQWLNGMEYGEVRGLRMKSEDITNAMVARFKNFFFIGWIPTRGSLAKSVLGVSAAVNVRASGVLDFCSKLNEHKADEMLAMKTMTSEMLCRQINLGRMLEIVTDTNVKNANCFNAHTVLKTVCGIAAEMLGKNDVPIRVKLTPEGTPCYGIEEDYCSAASTLISFAIRHCNQGKVCVESYVKDKSYIFTVSFKSGVPFKELEDALYSEETPKGVNAINLKADLLYIRCIAENGFWGLTLTESETKDITLSLSTPFAKVKTLELLQPSMGEKLRPIIEAQFVFLRKSGN